LVVVPWSAFERIVADRSDGVANGDGCQAAAAKRTVTDGYDRVGDFDAGQAAAAKERIAADGRNRVGDGHAGQAGAARERPIVNGGDGIGSTAVRDGCRDGHVT